MAREVSDERGEATKPVNEEATKVVSEEATKVVSEEATKVVSVTMVALKVKMERGEADTEATEAVTVTPLEKENEEEIEDPGEVTVRTEEEVIEDHGEVTGIKEEVEVVAAAAETIATTSSETTRRLAL